MKKYILSIDQGTTSSRVILYDTKFQTIDAIQKEFKQYFPKNGWVEHDALEIWRDVKSLLSSILKKNKVKASQILSIGIANQRETTVMWNKIDGKPVHKAIVWQDRRTTDICNKLKKDKLDKKIQRITGLVIDPYFSGTKIKWILQNNNQAKELLKKKKLLFGTIDSWLLWNLTEKKSHFTDITNASRTLLFDSQKEVWSSEILKILKIPRSILPIVKPNVYNFGVTKLFGEDINIGGMAGDQQAASIGQACINKGQSKSTYGTGCFLLMNIGRKFKLSKNNLLTTVAYKIGNKKMYCYEGSIFVAGSAMQWLKDKLILFKNLNETSLLYKNAKEDEQIIFIPALTGLGAPHWKPNVRGAIFGITRNTSAPEIVKATLDSIAFQTLDLVNSMQKDAKMKMKDMRVDGGMIRNNSFIQSISNILQTKIIKPQNIETTALGAAYLAGLNSGTIKDLKTIKNFWKMKKTFSPKIKKKIISKKILKWRETVKFLVKYHS
jgi:glycerol kinase